MILALGKPLAAGYAFPQLQADRKWGFMPLVTRGRAPGAHVAQAMIGDVEAAAETSEVFYRMWLLHGTVPEGFSLHKEARPNRDLGLSGARS